MPKKHITWTNNMVGVAEMAQRDEAAIAKTLGWHDLGVYYFRNWEENEHDLSVRMDGMIALLEHGDTVLFQYPTWNGTRFDNRLVDKFHAYGCKVIIHVHDMTALLFGVLKGDDLIHKMTEDADLLNKADAVILPSERMKTELERYGFRKDMPVLYQTAWCTPALPLLKKHEIKRQMFYTGSEDISEYSGSIPIHQFSFNDETRGNSRISWHGFIDNNELHVKMSKGGFGLVWSDDESFARYECMNQSYKFASYIAAGIPVMARKGSAKDELIEKTGIGFLVSSMEEASDIIESLADDEINKLYERVRSVQQLIIDGTYTKKMLIDAEILMSEI